MGTRASRERRGSRSSAISRCHKGSRRSRSYARLTFRGTVVVVSESLGLPSKLSPSRLKDFMQCPRLFYYKAILRLSSPPTEATARGTAAHYAFEHIFNHPQGERTPEIAVAYVRPAWRVMTEPRVARAEVEPDSPEWKLREAEKAWAELYDEESGDWKRKLASAADYRALLEAGSAEEEAFLSSAEAVVQSWFEMENPNKFTPVAREKYVMAKVGSALLHGFIDRLDDITGPRGRKVYVSDYKTGKMPKPRYEDDAFFQLEVYALLMKLAHGEDVSQLRLIYVKEGRKDAVLSRPVTEQMLKKTRAKIDGAVRAIEAAHKADDWAPRKQVLCDWCFFKNVCPAHNPELDGLLPEEIERRLSK